MEAEVVVIFTPLINISSTQGWETHWTQYLGSLAVTDGTAEKVDTNPIIRIDCRQEGYRTKTCEGTAYSHLYFKREFRNYC